MRSFQKRKMFYSRRFRHKPVWAFFLLAVFVVVFLDKTAATSENEQQQQQTTTSEPDASPGCKAPDIRFTVVKPEPVTEQPYAKFETTQIYIPEEFTTADVEFVERINIDLTARPSGDNHQLASIVNPFQIDMDVRNLETGGQHGEDTTAIDEEDIEDDADMDEPTRKRLAKNQKLNKKRRSGTGRRRRLENENGQSRGRGSRYKRQVIHYDPHASANTDKWSGSKLAAEGDVYYMHIEDILKSQSPNPELRLKLHRLKKKPRKSINKCLQKQKGDNIEQCKKAFGDKTHKQHEKKIEMSQTATKTKEEHHRRRGDSHEDKRAHQMQKRFLRDGAEPQRKHVEEQSLTGFMDIENDQNISEVKISPQTEANLTSSTNGSESLQRIKRKSGKTTGALSRPKGGGDSSSKTTSRKDKGIFDEEGGYAPVHPDDVDEEEEEEEDEEVDIQQQFTEVSEIRFPGEIGPLGDRRLCKIRCVKGKWVGPLCATNEEGKWKAV